MDSILEYSNDVTPLNFPEVKNKGKPYKFTEEDIKITFPFKPYEPQKKLMK